MARQKEGKPREQSNALKNQEIREEENWTK